MPAPSDLVIIQYQADLEKLKRDLLEMEDMNSEAAKKTVAEIERLTKELERMADAADRSSKDATDAMDKTTKSARQLNNVGASVAQQLPDVWTQIQMGTDPMRVLTQQGLQVVQVHMDLVLKGAKSLVAFMSGPFGIAIAAAAAVGAAAWYKMRKEAEITEAETVKLGGTLGDVSLEAARLGDATFDASNGMEDFREQIRGAALEIEILRGETTRYQAELGEISGMVGESLLAGAQQAAMQLVAAQDAVAEATKAANDEAMSAGRRQQTMINGVVSSTLEWNEASAESVRIAREQLVQAEEQLEAIRAERDEAKELLTVKAQLEEAAKQAAIAERERAEASKESAAAAAEEARYNREIVSAKLQLLALTKAAREDQQTEADRIQDQLDGQIKKIDELGQQYGNLPEIAEARAAVEARAHRDLMSYMEAEAAAAQKQHEADMQAAEQQKQQAISDAAGYFGYVSNILMTTATAYGQATGEAAERLVALAKASAIVEIAINTAVAITQALAQLGPVAGAAAAIGITALGAAQAAVVASQDVPTYHTGGMVRLAPDERTAAVRPGEAVLTERGAMAAGGEAGVNALNRGEPAGQQAPVYLQLGHQVFNKAYSQVAGLQNNSIRTQIRRQTGALAGVRS